MYAAKERETLVIETAHFFCLGCFYVHGILQKYRGQAVKDAANVCKKRSAEQLHADGLTMGKGADIFAVVSRGHRSDRTPPPEEPS